MNVFCWAQQWFLTGNKGMREKNPVLVGGGRVDLHKIFTRNLETISFLADFSSSTAAHVQVPCKFFSKGLCFIGFATSTLDDPDTWDVSCHPERRTSLLKMCWWEYIDTGYHGLFYYSKSTSSIPKLRIIYPPWKKKTCVAPENGWLKDYSFLLGWHLFGYYGRWVII